MLKSVNLVDLVKRFPTNIHLHKSVSMQPRTSRSQFADTFPPQSHEDRSEDVWLDRDAGERSGEEEPANTTKARPPVAETT